MGAGHSWEEIDTNLLGDDHHDHKMPYVLSMSVMFGSFNGFIHQVYIPTRICTKFLAEIWTSRNSVSLLEAVDLLPSCGKAANFRAKEKLSINFYKP